MAITCEEYVVNRLVEQEKKNSDLLRVIDQQDAIQDRVNEFMKVLMKYVKLKNLGGEGHSVVYFDNVYEEYDKDDFDFIAEFLGFDKDGRKTEENE